MHITPRIYEPKICFYGINYFLLPSKYDINASGNDEETDFDRRRPRGRENKESESELKR